MIKKCASITEKRRKKDANYLGSCALKFQTAIWEKMRNDELISLYLIKNRMNKYVSLVHCSQKHIRQVT